MNYKKLLLNLLIYCLFIAISACAVPDFAKPKKTDRDTPINAKERARKNVTEGRGVSLKGAFGGKDLLLISLAPQIHCGEPH